MRVVLKFVSLGLNFDHFIFNDEKILGKLKEDRI